MSETFKGTTHGKLIELDQAVSLPDGTEVVVRIEPVPLSEEERRARILTLNGAWTPDPSVGGIFETIAKERRLSLRSQRGQV